MVNAGLSKFLEAPADSGSQASFEWLSLHSCVSEEWAEIIKQTGKGKKIVIDNIAARGHAGWARAAAEVWDVEQYGPRPIDLPAAADGDDERWAETLFATVEGYRTYESRLERAAQSFQLLPSSQKRKYRAVAEVSCCCVCVCVSPCLSLLLDLCDDVFPV